MSDTEESTGEPPDTDESEETSLLAELAALDEELAAAVGDRFDRLEEVEAELEALEDELEAVEERLEHTRADFRNYKERAKRRQDEIRERATEDLIERLLEVRDNLGRALTEESDDVDSLREGVELTRKQFDHVFEEEGVERIDPEPGTEVDANRHEVMMRVESEQPGDTIDSVYRPGYEMAGKILRPAQVTVAEEPPAESTGSETDSMDSGSENGETEDPPVSNVADNGSEAEREAER